MKPIVHRAYDGRDIVLPDAPDAVLRRRDIPALAEQIGHDIVTASGTTLLGADNKAGVAEIVTAAEYLMAHPEIPHGPIRIAFTPDEEVGRGTLHFDVARFGAAVRLHDGRRPARRSRIRELLGRRDDASPFTASTRIPAMRKGRMVNAIKVAASFIDSLPHDALSPETTDGHGGLRPSVRRRSVASSGRAVKLLIRDFVTAGLQEKERSWSARARQRPQRHRARASSSLVEEQYRNMREVLDRSSAHRRVCVRGGAACGSRGATAVDPRRHGWLAAVVHGPADAEYLSRASTTSTRGSSGCRCRTWRRRSR